MNTPLLAVIFCTASLAPFASAATISNDHGLGRKAGDETIQESETDFQKLVRMIQGIGTDDRLTEREVDLLEGEQAKAPSRMVRVLKGQGDAEQRRECGVVYSEEDGVKGAAQFVYFKHGWKTGATARERWYKADLQGELMAMAAASGTLDEKGKLKAGTGSSRKLNAGTDAAAKALQEELGFWIGDWLRNLPR